MTHTYAQITTSGLVIAISQLSEAVDNPAMIPIPTYDASLLGAVYEGGEFAHIAHPEALDSDETCEADDTDHEAMSAPAEAAVYHEISARLLAIEEKLSQILSGLADLAEAGCDASPLDDHMMEV